VLKEFSEAISRSYVIVAHLSDLHLRKEDDAAGFARQLDRIVDRAPDHLAITGDVLDRWHPPLLEHALGLLAVRGLMDPDRLTIIHGNHDLASSGGHPRERSDLWRLVGRFWDPPPLLRARRREFYRLIARRAPGVGLLPPSVKAIPAGFRLAAIDTVTARWMPVAISRGVFTLRHAEGAIPHHQLDWLSAQGGSTPLIALLHHYPLPVAAYQWDFSRAFGSVRWPFSSLRKQNVAVRMELDPDDRERFWSAAEQARVLAVLCGHVHRARLDWHGEVAVGLNGQSGAEWAGRTTAYYRIEERTISVEHEATPAAVNGVVT